MTSADREQPSRDQELENIVDELDEGVAGEREAEGVPGKPSDRAEAATGGLESGQPDAATGGSGSEPPD